MGGQVDRCTSACHLHETRLSRKGLKTLRKRVAFITYIDMRILGAGINDSFLFRSAAQYLTQMLTARMRHYMPVVCRAPRQFQSNESGKGAFIVYVDLDPVPGEMYSKESAQNMLRNVILQGVPQFAPLISLAPSEFQPEYSNEGNI